MILVFSLIYFISVLSFNLPYLKEQNKVFLHLEKFNEKLNLIHIGISFDNGHDTIRFDFRPYNYDKSYLTTERDVIDSNFLFDDCIYTKNLLWGITNKSHSEIFEFETKYLMHNRYKLGIYDCRHYVNEFTIWSLNKPIPIWKLNNLWDDIN